ncbi:helix-turn-helix domain-containing protein [Salipiger sp.]|uniref:helix-turn-helix domain-containing protein n=1 Tax=Salipiger sp. TaxID=2078585 RepID=UPI003A970C5E
MARPEAERVGYALDLLAYYLDPHDGFFERLADLGLRLPAAEARILHALDRRRGEFVSLRALNAAANIDRPHSDWPDDRVIYARVACLRERLARARIPVEITAWSKVGYRLTASADFVITGDPDA